MSDRLEPTAAERRLIDAAEAGGVADLQSADDALNDPATGADWGPERTVRAEIIYALSVGTNPDWRLHAHGVRLMGAKIVGDLDFNAAELPHPLILSNCYVGGAISLDSATAHSIYLTGSHVSGIFDASRLRARFDVRLDSAFIAEFVVLLGARIEGTLLCGGATFNGASGWALLADKLTVDGNIFLRHGFKATGAIHLVAAKVGGNFDCGGATFENTHGPAICADGLILGGDVSFGNAFKAVGEVRLAGAKVGGDLNCTGGTFENPIGSALDADRSTIEGSAFFNSGFKASGKVRLLSATIGGNVDCSGGTFKNREGGALDLDHATIGGNLFLRDGFNAKGEVLLLGATIGANCECDGATLESSNGTALCGNRLTVEGGLFLRNGFKAFGEVDLVGARIGSNLECHGATFENSNGDALSAQLARVEGSALLHAGFKAIGRTSLFGAKIGGNLQCAGATFENPNGISLDLTGTHVGHSLALRSLAAPPSGIVSLGFAHVGELVDDPGSWPAPGLLILQGFEYAIVEGPTDAKTRREWLNRQPADQFRPQPYEQLIRVLRGMGHDRDAQKIAIAKQEALRKSGELGWLRWLWSWVLAVTVRYGYHPSLILVWMIPLVLIGSLVFWHAGRLCQMAPTKERIYLDASFYCSNGVWGLPHQYPKLQPIVYSLDVFFPVVDLQQKAYWQPTERLYRAFYWVHTVTGWFFTALAVAGLTRLVKRD